MTDSFYLGCDVGQIQDRTAIAVSQVVNQNPLKVRCIFLQTLPLGITFAAIAHRLAEIDAKLRSPKTITIPSPIPTGAVTLDERKPTEKVEQNEVVVGVDSTGIGQPVVEMVRDLIKVSRVIACRFTAGADPNYDYDYWKLPKVEMITNLKVLLQDGRLEIAGKSKDPLQVQAISEMIDELKNFQYNQPLEGGRAETFEARVGKHDDMVTALGLSCWLAVELSQKSEPAMFIL